MNATTPFSILLVDDDADVRGLFQLVMEHNNLSLTTFEDAESALDYLKKNTPSIIVMDIMLPGLDGYQALKQIRKKSLAPTSPVIATSAYYTPQTPDQILAYGFAGFLPKPYSPSTLMQYLQNILETYYQNRKRMSRPV